MSLDYHTSLKGKILKGQYRIDYKAAQGGMSWLYKVTHILLNEDLALKLLYPQLTEDPKTRSRFIDEAKIQFRLNHPNIVRVTEIIEEDRLLGIIQEWIKGTDLKSYLQNCPRLMTPGQQWYLLQPILDALHHAHNQGVVHRDIKPSNILLSQVGNTRTLIPKLADFGVAKTLNNLDDRTSTGMMIGTFKYISPEQIRESKAVDRRADVYSVGVMFYQLATGRFPFGGRLEKVLYQHLFEEPKPPSFYNESITPEVDEIILKCLAKKPEERFLSCKSLSEALERVMPEPEPLLAHIQTKKQLAPQPEESDPKANEASLDELAAVSSADYGAYKSGGQTGISTDRADDSNHSNQWLSDSIVESLFTESAQQSTNDTNDKIAPVPKVLETSHGPVQRPKSLELPTMENEDQPQSKELPGIHDADSLPEMSGEEQESEDIPKATEQEVLPHAAQPELPALPALQLVQDSGEFDPIPPKQPIKAVLGVSLVLILLFGAWLVLSGKLSTDDPLPPDKRTGSVRVPPPRTTTARDASKRPSPTKTAAGGCTSGQTQPCYGGPDGTQGKGICKAGTQTCQDQKWGPCEGAQQPTKELCNGKDDNCDGQVDEDFPDKGKACYTRKGTCRYKGRKRCHPKGKRLQCASLQPNPASGVSFVKLSFAPASATFTVLYRGKRMRIQGDTCLEAKGKSRITISSSQYQMCIFSLSAKSRKKTLKMKRKSDLEDAPNYCTR